jgi:hypothetical protein
MRVTPPPAATPNYDLPRFADWRPAYLASDGHVHVVTPDGRITLVGPKLPYLTFQGLNISPISVAPDGHTIVYDGNMLVFYDLAPGGHMVARNMVGEVPLYWSPDGTQMATGAGNAYALLNQTTVASVQVPFDPALVGGELIGWLDASHLVLTSYRDATQVVLSPCETFATSVSLISVEIHTGAARFITTIYSPGLSVPRFALAPDGRQVLFSNASMRDYPYTPMVKVIDTANGATRDLPAAAAAMGSGFTSVAWRPGGAELAVTTDFGRGDALLLNLRQNRVEDQIKPLATGYYAAEWSPDGTALLLSTANDRSIKPDTHDVAAVTFDAAGHATTTVLTADAIDFPFIGFVRTSEGGRPRPSDAVLAASGAYAPLAGKEGGHGGTLQAVPVAMNGGGSRLAQLSHRSSC